MLIDQIRIKNLRPHEDTGYIRLTDLNALIGKNDSGKSTVLYAIRVFLRLDKLEVSDIRRGIDPGDDTVIEIQFRNGPAELSRRRLYSGCGNLVLRKTFDRTGKKSRFEVQAYDFTNVDFQNLWSKKEQELNLIGDKYGLDFTRSGRSITNESKISKLTGYANQNGVGLDDVWFEIDGDNKKIIEQLLPAFHFFPSELSLETSTATFQKPFQETITETLEQDTDLRSGVTSKVTESVDKMKGFIEDNLKELTDTVDSIQIVPDLDWQKLVSINLEIIDNLGSQTPLEYRGSGLRRLVITSFLKYKSEIANKTEGASAIYGIEEPETSLHPGAQRVLLDSLRKLSENGNQVIFTTHSPVFSGELNQKEIKLIKRYENSTKVISDTTTTDFITDIVDELGIRPRDLLSGYSATVFVEGWTDVIFYQSAWDKLLSKGMIARNYRDVGIGFFPFGGDNLEFFVERRMLHKLNRKFAVLVDSDKKSVTEPIPQKKARLGELVRAEGGEFIVLRKREIENYIHPAAYKRKFREEITIDDFEDVKLKCFKGHNPSSKFKSIIDEMTPEELLERDLYSNNGNNEHELVNIFRKLKDLTD